MPTKVKPRTRADPVTGGTSSTGNSAPVTGGTGKSGSAVYLCDPKAYDLLCGSGYSDLSKNPEIIAGVDVLARLVASQTIYLMENTDRGDVRVNNALSRLVDIQPNKRMGRFNFIHWIVKVMWLSGNGNAVVAPITEDGLIQELRPIPPSMVSFVPNGWDYWISIGGRRFDPDLLLHFPMNPSEEQPWLGEGYRVGLKDVVHSLNQASKTKREFQGSKWKPSVIVKVEGLVDEFSSQKGRRKLLDSYIDTETAGEPWLIPAGTVDVKEVRPLSLNDLALADGVKLDKRTAAAILGMPAFLLGEGEFNQMAWNNFIATRVMHMSQIIQQTLTRGILYKPEWYFKMNPRSLYSYNLKDLFSIAKEAHAAGMMTGNEGRDWLDLHPLDGLDELVLLENYLPRDRLGDQKKLKGGDGTSTDDA